MDTANVEEIAKFVDWGVVYGVTTNPSLIAKSGRTQAEVIPEIAKLVAGPVSAEVISTECDGICLLFLILLGLEEVLPPPLNSDKQLIF